MQKGRCLVNQLVTLCHLSLDLKASGCGVGGGLWDGLFIRLGFLSNKELLVSPKSPLVPTGIKLSRTREPFKKDNYTELLAAVPSFLQTCR